MKTKPSKLLFRSPRILAIFFILFLTMFGFDMFGTGESIRIQIGGFLMHSIPSFILITILIISRKHEIVGAIAFILAGLGYITMTAINAPRYLAISRGMIIAGPVILTGILFWLNWKNKQKK